MPDKRKRILFCNEFSLMATGYANYGLELISRLYDLDKYDIAEFASYVSYDDAKTTQLPWKIYTNSPPERDQAAHQQLNSNPTFQFGAWRFDEVVLDFKPDIVVSFLDPWMFEHISSSPLRKYFRFLIMPTVDSRPQQEGWLEMFADADGVFTYSDWGLKVLEEEGAGRIKLIDSAPPCSNIKKFFPIPDKQLHRKEMGFSGDMFIVGTVMRNQKRKLYPDLFDAFNKYLEKCKGSPLYERSYLYCHVSYPDLGWDIPDLVKRYGLGHKIIFTYVCRNCSHIFSSFFKDARTVCPRCGRLEAGLPNTKIFIDPLALGAIMNLFDVYVQYSIAEGFGIPLVEAAQCGVPVMAVDYSAPEDIVRKLEGKPIKVQRLFLEPETMAYRAYPDNEHLADELYHLANDPKGIRDQKGYKSYSLCRKHYDWNKTAQKWENAIDSLESPQFGWSDEPRITSPATSLPQNLDNSNFVNWCIVNILGEPEKVNSYLAVKTIKELNYGASIQGFGGLYLNEQSALGTKPTWTECNRETIAQRFYEIAQHRNHWEQRRCGMIKVDPPDYIQYAKADVRELQNV